MRNLRALRGSDTRANEIADVAERVQLSDHVGNPARLSCTDHWRGVPEKLLRERLIRHRVADGPRGVCDLNIMGQASFGSYRCRRLIQPEGWIGLHDDQLSQSLHGRISRTFVGELGNASGLVEICHRCGMVGAEL